MLNLILIILLPRICPRCWSPRGPGAIGTF